MKKIHIPLLVFILSILFNFTSTAQASRNLDRLSSIDFSPQTLAGCWHYEANNKIYALIGASYGLIIIDITIPDSPMVVLQVPGIHNLWREVKVSGQHAYITTEGLDSTGILNGVQIVNLSYLPDSAPSKIYKGDGLIENQLMSAHSITSDENYIYINGHNIQSVGRGVLICDISDPWNPVYVGAVTNNYCHDSYVRGDTIWTSDIIAGIFSVYDISDRSNPVLLATQQTPGNFNHNAWLSDDGNTLFTTDERGNEPLGSFDVSDLNNITLLDTYFTNNFSSSEVHNVRVLNDFLINPSYGSQLTLVDASRPNNLVEVGNYTTGNYLLWDADPYFSNGVIAATETNPGIFFVFRPTYQRAAYLEGLITDSISGIPIPGATIRILGTTIQKNSKGTGDYYTGVADPGTYDIEFTKTGYAAKTISGVSLNTGIVTTLDVQLRPLGISVGTIGFAENISVSPNPFNKYLIVGSPDQLVDQINIFNILGEQVKTFLPESTSGRFELNTEFLPDGLYLVQLISKGSSAYRKLIKN